jgi:hypothetical protein
MGRFTLDSMPMGVGKVIPTSMARNCSCWSASVVGSTRKPQGVQLYTGNSADEYHRCAPHRQPVRLLSTASKPADGRSVVSALKTSHHASATTGTLMQDSPASCCVLECSDDRRRAVLSVVSASTGAARAAQRSRSDQACDGSGCWVQLTLL